MKILVSNEFGTREKEFIRKRRSTSPFPFFSPSQEKENPHLERITKKLLLFTEGCYLSQEEFGKLLKNRYKRAFLHDTLNIFYRASKDASKDASKEPSELATTNIYELQSWFRLQRAGLKLERGFLDRYNHSYFRIKQNRFNASLTPLQQLCLLMYGNCNRYPTIIGPNLSDLVDEITRLAKERATTYTPYVGFEYKPHYPNKLVPKLNVQGKHIGKKLYTLVSMLAKGEISLHTAIRKAHKLQGSLAKHTFRGKSCDSCGKTLTLRDQRFCEKSNRYSSFSNGPFKKTLFYYCKTCFKTLEEKKGLNKREEIALKRLENRLWIKIPLLVHTNNPTTGFTVKEGRVHTLFLRGIPLETFPKEILQFKFLEYLRLEYAGLKSIPPEINELSLLETLSLEGNELSALPDSVKDLRKLDCIFLCCNRFPQIPPPLFRLPILNILCLAHNLIT
ncbi:MAG: hypothetical protein GF383_14645, partial [Candidatus Lokiarchaeota archaeon]|nr:hypothetical protein [Candidatus Lokiarchaeota archaeon]MBD3342655.1 hypothetical protein [Candidatus Lokiarchaeota archaeon]